MKNKAVIIYLAALAVVLAGILMGLGAGIMGGICALIFMGLVLLWILV